MSSENIYLFSDDVFFYLQETKFMTWEMWAALAVVCVTVYGLLKRWETRLVLLTSGFVMCLLSLNPIAAFQQFDKSMTSASLIIVICSTTRRQTAPGQPSFWGLQG